MLSKFEVSQQVFDQIKALIEMVNQIAPGVYRNSMIRDGGTALDLSGYALVVGDLPARLRLKAPPRELDVPHWARQQVDADRMLLDRTAGRPTRNQISDRMIYARLVDIGALPPGDEKARMVARERMLSLIDETAP